MRRAPAALAALTLALLPLAAGAGAFQPPEGCALDLTVQMRGCVLGHYYRCAADTPGDRWAAFLDRDGLFSVTRIDAETRWMESLDPVTGVTERLVPEAHAHASFTRLIETGRDDFDFAVVGSDGSLRRYRGHDLLTGETRTIDRQPLEVSNFAIDVLDVDGVLLYHREGSQFVDRARRLFFAGTDRLSVPGQPDENWNETPVSFATEGQPGFGAITPLYDCDVLLTGAPRGSAG